MELSNPASPVTRWLSRTSGFWFTLYTSLAAFFLYSFIFGFRKTFTAATFENISYLGLEYKAWLVIFQMLGYGLAKFIGIKIISELQSKSRALGILLMVSIAAISWLFFALVPAPYNIVFLFTNGLPLGMVWGMVFGYLEGRRMTEVLGASLSVSFIFSSGLSRSFGSYAMQSWGVTDLWMPFVASCVFFIPFLVFLFLLDKVPPPTPRDEVLRTRRRPMNSKDRSAFVKTFLPGIILFVLTYMLLTAFRDFRDNFSADVWKSLGYGNSPGIFSATEVPISCAVLLIMGSIMLIKNNLKALIVNHLIIASGMILIGVSTLLFEEKIISPPVWMILMGLGLYMGYIPFNSIFFDRLIAAFKFTGTVGFIMYVADSFGYLGSIGVTLFKSLGLSQFSWLEFFIVSGYIFSVTGTLLILGSMVYFYKKHTTWEARVTDDASDQHS